MDNGWYKEYIGSKITKEVLDQIQVGDYVRCNGWKKPMIVVAVNDTHFIMIKNHFKTFVYSICEKLPSTTTRNCYHKGKFRIGPDNAYGAYDYTNLKECEEALIRLKDGYSYTPLVEAYEEWKKTANSISVNASFNLELSRKAIDLDMIEFKHSKWNKDNIQEYITKYFSNANKF